MEANGFFGGLWFLWNQRKFTIDIIGSTFQSISVKVIWNGCQTWMLTGIYASPCNTSRSNLWSYLDNLFIHVNLPCMLVEILMSFYLSLIKLVVPNTIDLGVCKTGSIGLV
ncbi:hypothetical protein RchiOBHm_Chr5g0054841 [Rosa chinensis]|uniref:Uncharacterized protein n=1 Tax=Rosa chinensis TaxID=74649 RepID=A0A2P6QG93_ROSCH|nr:hypothetical protein RchiOBHm_Chr5g0054841 [Rosa chinensis]